LFEQLSILFLITHKHFIISFENFLEARDSSFVCMLDFLDIRAVTSEMI